MRGKMATAILAQMTIARQDISPVQVEFLLGQAIKRKEPNDTRHLDLEVDRADPIFVGLFVFGTQFAHLSPGFERVGGKLPFFEMDHLGQLATKQPDGAFHIDDVDGHIEPIEHQYATRQSAPWGGWSGSMDNKTLPTRAFRSRPIRIGSLNCLHVQTPLATPDIGAIQTGWVVLAPLP
jgi:hypothetical protein